MYNGHVLLTSSRSEIPSEHTPMPRAMVKTTGFFEFVSYSTNRIRSARTCERAIVTRFRRPECDVFGDSELYAGLGQFSSYSYGRLLAMASSSSALEFLPSFPVTR